MARINMIKSAVSRRTSAHAPMDNVTTPYNPIRLLKGAPPGQVSCNILKILYFYHYWYYYLIQVYIIAFFLTQRNVSTFMPLNWTSWDNITEHKKRQTLTTFLRLNPKESMITITIYINQASTEIENSGSQKKSRTTLDGCKKYINVFCICHLDASSSVLLSQNYQWKRTYYKPGYKNIFELNIS